MSKRPCLAALGIAIVLVPILGYGQTCPCGSTGFGNTMDPAYGPGRLVFVSAVEGQSEVLTAIFAGPDQGPYEMAVHIGSTNLNTPAWSPDGTRIVFSDFFMLGIATRESQGGWSPFIEPLTTGEYDTNPTWSPDGTTIAFARATGGWSVCSIPAAGGAVTTLWPGKSPAWSPDGALIAYELGSDLWLGSVATGPLQRLTDGHRPAWSPDGRWIAYARTVAGNEDIWAIRATGGTPVRLTTDPAADTDPTWSSDGDTIAYTYLGCSCLEYITDFPDPTVGVEPASWGTAKALYR